MRFFLASCVALALADDSTLHEAVKNCDSAFVAKAVGPPVRVSAAQLDAVGYDDLNPPLVMAPRCSDAMVQMLIDAGADLEKKGFLGNTPLHSAALRGRSGSIEVLLKAGASLEPTNMVGATPLILAAVHKHEDVVQVLLAAGAQDGSYSKHMKAAREWAVKQGPSPVTEHLLIKDEL